MTVYYLNIPNDHGVRPLIWALHGEQEPGTVPSHVQYSVWLVPSTVDPNED